MPNINIQGTIIPIPDSAESPNWAPALIQAFQAIANALELVSGTFDISPQTYNIDAYNSATNQNISGLSFPIAEVRSAVITYYVIRETSLENTMESGQIFIDYDASRSINEKWSLSREAIGDSEISFNITDNGQVQFSTVALSGTGHTGTIGFFAKTLGNE